MRNGHPNPSPSPSPSPGLTQHTCVPPHLSNAVPASYSTPTPTLPHTFTLAHVLAKALQQPGAELATLRAPSPLHFLAETAVADAVAEDARAARAASGEEKSKFVWYKIWTLSIIAGCYVGFGYTTCLLIAGNLSQAPGVGSDEDENYGLFKLVFGAVGFPFGFTTIVVCGAELYTSLCAYMTAAWWEGKVRPPGLARHQQDW
ncbi:putative formate transporter [Tetrabaena socialis]|uniref:Putative formate transporter n=1 Tax=Tetrabaena socialis TaxID=47790 RepID=A0A2J8A6I9_9CHLO|nr:putative formate transporter [Tetrabaena socialis]|eukprot:PNH08103.1 putative formate transporter [Tetrabaena socialis]